MRAFWTFILACLSCWTVTVQNVSAQDQYPVIASVQGSKTTPQIIREIQQTLQKEFYPDCYNIKPLRMADLEPPHMTRVTSFPAGTTWSETWVLDICSATKIHHIDFTMRSINDQVALEMSVRPAQTAAIEGRVERAKVDRGKIPVVQALAGSPATQPMIFAVQEYLHSAYYASCPEIKPLSTLSVFPNDAARKKDFKIGDAWAETWLIETCSGPQKHHIDFFIAPVKKQSGLLLRVQPALDK